DDPSIKGVFVRAAEMNLGSSRAEELRDAFLRLRAKNKFVIAHSQGFLASGPSAYRAISAANEIWLQPGTSFEAPGITFETMFFGGAMEKFKVTPEIEQFYEFKGAADTFKQKGYTTANATAMTALATSVWTHSIADIAADRKTDATTMRALLEASPYTAETAAELKLVDRLGYPEEAAAAAEKQAGGKLLKIEDYHPNLSDGRAVIAIVGGEGDIVTGDGGPVNITSIGTPSFASDRVAKSLLDIAEDKSINAVVFRIDSGGGSPTASDQVWNAVKKVQASGKKVVVSMGSMAASGGYYAAASADSIVAARSTITGSIGVFGGKFAIADALREFGISPDAVTVGGEFASAYSMEKLTPAQRAKMHEGLQATYDRFIGIVAEGRKLPTQQVQEIARGRIWSGEDAQENGLVNKTGDIVTALEEARTLAGFKPEDKIDIRLNIHRTTPFELLTGSMMGAQAAGSSDLQIARALASIVGENRAAMLIDQFRRISQPGNGAQVWMPPVSER
ncbi:MAG TPA: signal peptide peptidase SppA, partial [Hyphomonadaceae bacterium]|nr:signal peptide peptidase SppA [Hyphomonadaceae bacterium]